jgi:hypothetical protein
MKTNKSSKKIIIFVVSISLCTLLVLTFIYLLNKSNSGQIKPNNKCTPYNIETNSLDSNRIQIKWKTDDLCLGYIKYGASVDAIQNTSVDSISERSRTHSSEISNLSMGFKYYYLISSDGKLYGFNNLPLSFSTKAF